MIETVNDNASSMGTKHSDANVYFDEKKTMRAHPADVTMARVVVFANSRETDFPNIVRASSRLLRRDFLEK